MLRLIAFALAVAACLIPFTAAHAQREAFAGFGTPSDEPPMPVGSYANGCLQGGVALPSEGLGYQVVRRNRNAFWGHPRLIAYIEDLGRRAHEAGLNPLLIADLGQPRGGPIRGHASHQIGLDADIWLRQDLPPLAASQREGLRSTLVVDRAAFTINPATWSEAHATLIRLAASDARVSRIFVHPAIKIALCERTWADRSWLGVVRPWFGHDSHIHVRLHCAHDDIHCQPQEPVPDGDGCDADLYSWIPDPTEPPPPVLSRPPPPPLHPICAAMVGDGS